MGMRDKGAGTAMPAELSEAIPRVRRRTPSADSSERRKRRRGEGVRSPRMSYSSSRAPMSNGATLSKSRRLYVGNIPFHVGLSDAALQQFFSALYVAGFRPCRSGESLPVLSVWLHADGKFGFMELRGDQEAVNMMQLNGVYLHGRPLRINRPSDYRPDVHNPGAAALAPHPINACAVSTLCEQLDGLAAPPTNLRSPDAPTPPPAAVALSTSPPPAANGTNGAPSLPPPPPAPSVPRAMPALRSAPSPTAVAPRNGNGHVKQQAMDIVATAAAGAGGGADTNESNGTAQSTPGLGIGGNVIALVDLANQADFEGTKGEYEEILEDVKGECEQYGEVRVVQLPRTGNWKGSALIEYGSAEEAEKAVEQLVKRVFDGKLIDARVVSGCATASAALSRAPLRKANANE